jgi:hypothetical protein
MPIFGRDPMRRFAYAVLAVLAIGLTPRCCCRKNVSLVSGVESERKAIQITRIRLECQAFPGPETPWCNTFMR